MFAIHTPRTSSNHRKLHRFLFFYKLVGPLLSKHRVHTRTFFLPPHMLTFCSEPVGGFEPTFAALNGAVAPVPHFYTTSITPTTLALQVPATYIN